MRALLVPDGLALALERVAVALHWLPETPHDWADPGLAAPIVAVVLTTWLAAWVGSRRVLTVTPLQAVGGSQPLSHEELRARPARNALAITLIVVGTAILVLPAGSSSTLNPSSSDTFVTPAVSFTNPGA